MNVTDLELRVGLDPRSVTRLESLLGEVEFGLRTIREAFVAYRVDQEAQAQTPATRSKP